MDQPKTPPHLPGQPDFDAPETSPPGVPAEERGDGGSTGAARAAGAAAVEQTVAIVADENAGNPESQVFDQSSVRMALYGYLGKTRETGIALEDRLSEALTGPYSLFVSADLTLGQIAERLRVSDEEVVALGNQIIDVARDIIQVLPPEEREYVPVRGAHEINEIRIDIGMTQRALAGAARISHSALQQFFKGDLFLSADKVQAMLDYMQVPAGEAEAVMAAYERDRGGQGREAVVGIQPHGRLVWRDVDTRQIAIEAAGEAELQGVDLRRALTGRQFEVLEILRNTGYTRDQAARKARVVPHALSMAARRIEAAVKRAIDDKREGLLEPEPEGVGPELLARRNATAGATRDTMAAAMGISPSYLDKVLNGQTYTDPDRIRLGALHLGMTPKQANEYATRFEAEFVPPQDHRAMRPAVIETLRAKMRSNEAATKTKWPQSRLARESGVDIQQVERLLRGVSYIPPEQVRQLLMAAGFTEEEVAFHAEQYEADKATRDAAANFARRKQRRN